MGTLLLILLLFFAGVSVIYAAGTLFLQAYIYSQPTEGLVWRAPAAGGALTLVLLLWVVLDYYAPGKYRTIFEFSPREEVAPFEELRVVNRVGEEDRYLRLETVGGRDEYRLDGRRSGRLFPSRPEKIIAIENDQKVIFEPEKVGKGQYQTYTDEQGRTMTEGSWHQVSYFRTSWLFGNLVLNFLFFVALFVPIWLLLAYQWHHAFGLALALWGIMILFVVPPLLSRVESTAVSAGIERVTHDLHQNRATECSRC